MDNASLQVHLIPEGSALRAIAPRSMDGDFMEHRWGQRHACSARVFFSAAGGVSGLGRLRDVSMSGAFLQAARPLPLLAELAVTVLRNDGVSHALQFPARVVRQERGGVGIEWCDPDPGFICRKLGCATQCAFARGRHV